MSQLADLMRPTNHVEQRLGAAFMTDSHTSPTMNEGNLLSLITLNSFLDKYPDTDEAKRDKEAIYKIAKEEQRYVMAAMHALTGDGFIQERLRNKFGADLKGVVKVAAILKDRADELEMHRLLDGFAMDASSRGPHGGGRAKFIIKNEEEQIRQYGPSGWNNIKGVFTGTSAQARNS